MDEAPTDTIAAIATPPGAGGVGVIRVSGPLAPDIARQLLGRAPRPRHAHYARLHDAAGDLLDHALLLFFPAPRSFTGEHVLELQAHGSPPLLQALLRRLHQLGARAARPGEFSERAFLNDKLDLAQAEAIADLIAAGSEAAARAALRSLEGVFSRRVTELFERLVEARLHVEAAIDFPEEEIDFLGDGQIAARLLAIDATLATLRADAERGQRLRDGLHVVIVGPPNAGKSSLLNALAGLERAIVADVPGTTRDLLRETVVIDGIELTLVDTAGLREGGDAIEREGMRRAGDELERADLALVVLGPGDAIEPILAQALQRVPRIFRILSKRDLAPPPPSSPEATGEHFPLSVRTGEGLERLIDALKRAAGQGEGSDGAFSARARHLQALGTCQRHLNAARRQLQVRAGELVAEELRLAQTALGEITGEFRSDDLLGRIFGSFCIGK
jgi:tRNA modification GTPase